MVGMAERESLIRAGRLMGLSPFESNLVIAIVQDQARRGLGPENAERLLSYVPLRQETLRSDRRRRIWRIALWSAAALAGEALIIVSLLR